MIADLLQYGYGKKKDFSLEMPITRTDLEKDCEDIFDRIRQIIDRCMNDRMLMPDDIDKVVLVGGSSEIPAVQNLVEEYFGCKPNTERDLSTLVAKGAAIRAAGSSNLVLSKLNVKNTLSFSLGLRLNNGTLSVILPKGTEYPCSNNHTYTTSRDYQKTIEFEIYEGNNKEYATRNQLLGKVILENIKEARQGVPSIEVNFYYDINKILRVTAKDLSNNSIINCKIDTKK